MGHLSCEELEQGHHPVRRLGHRQPPNRNSQYHDTMLLTKLQRLAGATMPASLATLLDVRPLTRADAEACDQIICTLPHHFGHEAGRQACALAVRSSAGWVAVLQGHVV